MELSLRSKIIAVGVFLLIFSVLTFGVLIYFRTSNNLKEIAKKQFFQIAKSMADMVDLSLKKESDFISYIAADPVIVKEALKGKNERTRKKLKELYTKLIDEYEGLAAYDKNGIICADGVDRNREGLSIAEREYFVRAKSGKKHLGAIVSSKATGKPIFAISSPIRTSNGDFCGGIIGVARAQTLMKYIDSMKIGNTGYAFMLDRHEVIIAHPTEPLYKNFQETKASEKLKGFINARKEGAVEYFYKNEKKIAGVAYTKISDWTIGVSQIEKETMMIAYASAKYIFLFGIVFIIIGLLFVIYLSKQISLPVQNRLIILNQAIEQAEEALFILDKDGMLQFFNSKILEITNSEPRLGNPLSLKQIDEKTLISTLSMVKEGNTWSGRLEGNHGDGSPFVLELSISPILEKSGKLNSYLGIGRDITSKLQLQEQVLQSQKMEAIGTLAGGIAHDFNNILSAIVGYTDLATDAVHNNRDKLEPYLNGITKASLRAKDLVEHILYFSRKKTEEVKPLALKYIVKDTIKLVRASLPSTISIEEDLQSSATILGDASQMHQIIMNLCTNAGYAMKKHGGVLKLVLKEVNGVTLKKIYSDAKDKNYLRLDVVDTGSGMPEDIIDKIFDPFFTTKPVGEGTGLGLSMVHGLIKSINGFISVESELEKGTTFTIYLPVEEMEAECGNEILHQKYPKGNERILLVDDEPSLIDSGKERLERLGYEVTSFLQSTDALSIFKKNPDKYDIILTDYTMPDLTGIDLAREIHHIRSDIPIVICSGSEEVKSDIVNMDKVSFLKKPFFIADLSVELRKLLDN